MSGKGSSPAERAGVSVLMLVYNHERYLAQALDSVLAQKTPFPVEIVVGEDCSTDRSREILASYARSYPGRVRPLLRERNLGMIGNLVDTYRSCTGRYVALLEGDDYWTAEDKLETQVALLEAQPGLSSSFHDVTVVYEDTAREPHRFHSGGMGAHYSLRDVVSSFFIPTCSTVFRAGLIAEFPPWFFQMPMGDWPLHVLHAEKGDFGYVDRAMAVYRVHGAGLWSGSARPAVLEQTLRAVDTMEAHLGGRLRAELARLRAGLEHKLSRALLGLGDRRGALRHAGRAVRLSPGRFVYARDLLRVAAARIVRGPGP
ncbi:MAG: glycosyltransferase [Deferrisomatales bacterium]|nr:glycosyltransferase [Deferrisomatales bacterium]